MKKLTGILAPLIVLLAGTIATGSVALAADPDEDDITVIGYGAAPGCFEIVEGKIFMSNSSSEYWCKVQVNVTVENQAPGNSHCGCEPPDCCNEPCECEISDTYEVDPEEDREFKDGCAFPNCLECEQHCDNVMPSQCPPNDVHHCACPYGSYVVTHYSINGTQWTAMPPSYRKPITEKEQDPDCPMLGPDCS
jgi:hypothetical protein